MSTYAKIISVSLGLTIASSLNTSRAQSIFNLFEENNTLKIQEWIKANPTGEINIFNDQLHDFYNKRLPTENLNCVPQKMNILELAILNGNSIIYNDLLKQPEYFQNIDLLSQALNFALAKNNSELFKKLESLGAKYNAVSPYFYGQNTLQIAFSYAAGSDLTKLIIEKSTTSDFNHLDCLNRSALYYLAANRSADLSKFPLSKMDKSVFLGTDDIEYPIELLLKNGDLANARLLWSAMREQENFQDYATAANFKRLKFHAFLSKNTKVHDWVDSLAVRTFKLDKKKINSFYTGDNSIDLGLFIDQALIYSDYFFNLSQIDKSITESDFLSFLKSWQNVMSKELGIEPNIQPTFHGLSGLIPMDDVLYISRFFTNSFWFQFWTEKLSNDELDKVQMRQEILGSFLDINHPKRFQSNFIVDYGDLSGLRGQMLDRARFILSNLSVCQLTVENITDFPMNYDLFFPNVNFLELRWIDEEMPTFAVDNNFLGINTIKFTGVKEIQFPLNTGKINLKTVIVPEDAELLNLPKGVKVFYE